jgi:hypothetical protein
MGPYALTAAVAPSPVEARVTPGTPAAPTVKVDGGHPAQIMRIESARLLAIGVMRPSLPAVDWMGDVPAGAQEAAPTPMSIDAVLGDRAAEWWLEMNAHSSSRKDRHSGSNLS